VYPELFVDPASDTGLHPFYKEEAELLYCLRTLLRFDGIKCEEFFCQLAAIEAKVSARILKKGSLFKLLFQMDDEA
jgi:hypothetical protein